MKLLLNIKDNLYSEPDKKGKVKIIKRNIETKVCLDSNDIISMYEIKETETTKTETTKAIKKETIEDFIKNPDFLKPYRLNNEPDLHYEIRRKLNKFYLKEKKRRLVWLSKDISKES